MGPGGGPGDMAAQPGGDYLNAYQDPVLLNDMMWGTSGGGTVADLQTRLAGLGPIPPDVPETTPQLTWDPKDGVTVERHVYFYGFAPSVTNAHKNPADMQLCLQVAGLAASRNPPMWILPVTRTISADIQFFTLAAGSTLAAGQWDDNGTAWILKSSGFASAYAGLVNTVIAIIGAAFDAGGLAGALEKAAQNVILMLPTIANAISTGNATGLLASFAGVVEGICAGVLHDTGAVDAIKAAFNNAGAAGADLVNFVDTSGKTITNIVGQAEASVSGVVQQSQVYVNQLLSQSQHGIPGSFDQVLATVVGQRGGLGQADFLDISRAIPTASSAGLLPKDFPVSFGDVDSLIGKAAQDAARAVLVAGDPGSVAESENPATHFFDMATGAADFSSILALSAGVPGYALEYFLSGAALRAAQLSAGAYPQLRSYYPTMVPRPGGGIAGASFMTKPQKALAVVHAGAQFMGK